MKGKNKTVDTAAGVVACILAVVIALTARLVRWAVGV